MIDAKIPPNALEIEVAVLGAILINPAVLPAAISRLFPDVFYQPDHVTIFTAVRRLYDNNKPVDIETLIYELKSMNKLRIGNGLEGIDVFYVTQLIKNVVSANIETHINILLECYMKRAAINLSLQLMEESFEISSDPFNTSAKAFDEFLKIQEKVLRGSEKDAAYYVMKVANNRDAVLQTGTIGIPTGLEELDKLIGGLVKPDLIIIAARPGMGKTAMMLSILHHLSVVSSIAGAIFSLEMSGEQLIERLEAIDSGIFHKKLRYNDLSDYDRQLLLRTENKISSSPIYIEDKAAINIRDIRTKANLLKRKYGIQYLMIDYLQLMKGIEEKNKSREQVISEISRGCKEIAKELEIPVIALSQLSREVEKRGDKMPQLSDLRESGSIEQDADEVIFLMRPEYYGFIEPVRFGAAEYDTKGLVICKIDKNRHGETKTIPLKFVAPLMHYTDFENELQILGETYEAVEF